MATQMQLKVLFRTEITWPPGQQQSRVFFGVIFNVYTEEELERVIENKGDEFRRKKNMEIQSGGEKMRNASGQ